MIPRNSYTSAKQALSFPRQTFKGYGSPPKMSKTILVTGGSGLVGHGLQSLSPEYPQYRFVFASSRDVDLTDYPATKAYVSSIRPDAIIHLASNVGGLFKNMRQKVQMLEMNLLINYHVLRVAHELKVGKVISCLSTCIFPDKTTYPIDETMLHLGPPHTSNDAYAYAKRLLDIHSRAYREQYGDNFVTVIPTNVYGPHDNYSLEDGHVVPALIHRCFLAKIAGKPFIVKGSGKSLRQFIHSQDLARIMLWVLEHYNEGEPLILAPDESAEISIADVARAIAQEFDYEHAMVFDTQASDGQYKKTASNAKLKRLYPEATFRSFAEGIRESVAWFKAHHETCRK